MHTAKKKKEVHWVGLHPGRRLSAKNGYRKKMEESGQKEDEDRSCCIGCWQVFIESLKRRPSSERSGDFGLLNLPRKNKLVILFHTELMTGEKNSISPQNT